MGRGNFPLFPFIYIIVMIQTYPERKKYNYVINTTKWKLNIKLMQATANETKDFYELLESVWQWNIIDNVDKIQLLNKYYINLIKDWIERWKWRQIRKNIRKRQVRLLVKRELASYIDEVVWMCHKTRESVYTNKDTPKINWKKPRWSIFNSEKEVIYEKTGIPAHQVYDTLTMEQIGWYLDKSVFEYYEMFDEGKKINNKLLKKSWVGWLTKQDKLDLEFIKSQKL